MTTTKPPQPDYYTVMEDTMGVAQYRRDMYQTLIEHGHRRPDPKEERIIASLEKAAELAELEWNRQGRRF